MGEIRNYIKLILIGVAILVTVTMIISATGCDILPPPASAIKPPQYIMLQAEKLKIQRQ